MVEMSKRINIECNNKTGMTSKPAMGSDITQSSAKGGATSTRNKPDYQWKRQQKKLEEEESTQQTTEATPRKSSSFDIPEYERAILWRDFTFLILGGMALRIVSYVETNAAYSNRVPLVVGVIQSYWLSYPYGGGGITDESDFTLQSDTAAADAEGTSIIDAGFVLTTPLYEFLASHRDINDILAGINSIILIIPMLFVAKVTLWDGDYTLAFRLLATQLFRSFCGWFTYLPPDPTFLMSVYDFPEIVQCMVGNEKCANSVDLEPLPFVSFFSGHVASTVIIANYMYLRGCEGGKDGEKDNRRGGEGESWLKRYAVILHIFNFFQILRLLASRGHYSIDIIIGWAVAVYVSNPAERLGRYYSRGASIKSLLVPSNKVEAFETVIGVNGHMKRSSSSVMANSINLNGVGGGGGYRSATSSRLENGGGDNRAVRRGNSSSDEEGEEGGGGGRGADCDHDENDSTAIATTTANTTDDDFGFEHTTAAKVVYQMAGRWARENLPDVRAELEGYGLKLSSQEMKDLISRRGDLIRLMSWAQLKVDELREEAVRLGLHPMEGMRKRDIIFLMIAKTRSLMERRARMASEFAMSSMADMRNELVRHGMRAQEVGELRRKDLIRLLDWAQLKVEELRSEAKRTLDLHFNEGMSKREMIIEMLERTKCLMEERAKLFSSFPAAFETEHLWGLEGYGFAFDYEPSTSSSSSNDDIEIDHDGAADEHCCYDDNDDGPGVETISHDASEVTMLSTVNAPDIDVNFEYSVMHRDKVEVCAHNWAFPG